MGKIIITSGFRYTDIDVLACAIAYKELLEKENKNAAALLPGVFNKSITSEIRGWKLNYETEYQPDSNDSFVVVDLSEPEYVNPVVNQKKIIELYDHHFGYEKYWKKILGEKAKIEQVGSCATLIWEEFKNRHQPDSISQESANLLYTAIISNTLNFKASVTDHRDIIAFKEIKPFTKLSKNWTEEYFIDQEKAVLANPREEIINDTHIEKFPDTNEELVIGQIELWDSRKFVYEHTVDIKKALESFNNPYWFLTSPSISEGKNYIYCESEKVQDLLKEKLNIIFKNNLAETKKLLLRKEIKKIIYNY